MANDLRRISDEIARIEREFKGAVNFTVLRDSEFGVALDALGVRFRFVEWKRLHGHADLPLYVPCRSFNARFVEMGWSSSPLASFIDTFIPHIKPEKSDTSHTRQHRLD